MVNLAKLIRQRPAVAKDNSATGEEAKNTAGAIKGAEIQGNSKLSAAQKKVCANTVGKNNNSANQTGQIGGS